jgi:trehalose 6-phosphate synthase
VGRINGDLAEVGRPPIHYPHRSVPVEQLIAYYRAADVMFVTPARRDESGRQGVCCDLIRQHRSAGARSCRRGGELPQAFVVNPYDLDTLATRSKKRSRRPPCEATGA